ncbi:hypothetical protein D3C78_1469680 [compost metagenome]
MLRFDVQDDHVRLLRDRLFDVEGAVFKTAESGNIGDCGKFTQVGRVGIRVGLNQILAPAHDALHRVLCIQGGNQIQLPPLPQDHAPHGHANLDLAPEQIGHSGAGRFLVPSQSVGRHQCQQGHPEHACEHEGDESCAPSTLKSHSRVSTVERWNFRPATCYNLPVRIRSRP